jgi:hypothetical protein
VSAFISGWRVRTTISQAGLASTLCELSPKKEKALLPEPFLQELFASKGIVSVVTSFLPELSSLLLLPLSSSSVSSLRFSSLLSP